MADSIRHRLVHAWNAFFDKTERESLDYSKNYSSSYSYGSTRLDKVRPRFSTERTTISSIYNRLSVDFASYEIHHIRMDDQKRFLQEIRSPLNDCLTVKSNIDQTAEALKIDIAQTLFEEGMIALVPVETSGDPFISSNYDILNIRVGRIVTFFPQTVRVNVYNEKTGRREELTLPKSMVAVVENPFYSIMNEPNSTLQRLNRKLSLLDVVDEQSSSGKLDLIIQLPYVVKSEARKRQADERRKDIEFQLTGSKYGVAYTDGTERITQLNRPIENNLLKQVEYLTGLLYSQLGVTESIINGTADSNTMLNYYIRTINPIMDAVVESMHSTFLTKTARTQNQAITYYRDPWKLMPLDQFANVADVLSRNEIASPNEIRSAVGWIPSKDENADKLHNSNMPDASSTAAPDQTAPVDINMTGPEQKGKLQNGV